MREVVLDCWRIIRFLENQNILKIEIIRLKKDKGLDKDRNLVSKINIKIKRD